MKMENKMLKLLIIVCGLCLSVNVMAVEYKFQTMGSMSQQVFVPLQAEAGFTFLSEQQSAMSSSKSILDLRKQSATNGAASGDGLVMPAFSSRSVTPIYEGFDAPEVSMNSSMSLNNLNGPMKEPPMKPDPWTPVGDGWLMLLLLAGGYIISKRYRI